jgi:hypothetical protein
MPRRRRWARKRGEHATACTRARKLLTPDITISG